MTDSNRRLVRIFGAGFTLLAILNLVFTILKTNYPDVGFVITGASIFCREITFYIFYAIIGSLIILAREVDDLKKKSKDDNK